MKLLVANIRISAIKNDEETVPVLNRNYTLSTICSL